MQKFNELYEKIKYSKKENALCVILSTFVEVMEETYKTNPNLFKKMVEKMESFEWKQYLSHDEAQRIVQSMNPPAKWGYHPLMKQLETMKLDVEEPGVFNSCALYAVMSMIYSDDANTLARIMDFENANQTPDDKMLEAIHALAFNKLKDKDERFNVRKYFEV